MANQQEKCSFTKHQTIKPKWKTSPITKQKSEESKYRKTRKQKLLLSKVNEEIPIESQSIKDNHQLNEQHNRKFIKVTQKLMTLTLVEKKLTEFTRQHQSKINENDDNKTSTNQSKIDGESLIVTEIEQKNVELMNKLDQYDQSDVLTIMDLSSMNIKDNDIPILFKRIFEKEKQNYRNLILRDNSLTSIGVKHLVDGLLKTSVNIKNLGLSSNPNIGDAGIEHLVRLLRQTRSITILALHHTGMTDKGVRLLADVLCDHQINSFSPIEKLYISFNKGITDLSLQSLIRIIEQNRTLKIFGLQYCSLSDRARRRLRLFAAKKNKNKFSFAA